MNEFIIILLLILILVLILGIFNARKILKKRMGNEIKNDTVRSFKIMCYVLLIVTLVFLKFMM